MIPSDSDAALDLPIDHPFVLVVPCYDETEITLDRLLISCDPSTLVIVVVNRSVSSPWAVKGSNDQLIAGLLERATSNVSKQNLHLLRFTDDGLPDVLLVDCNRDDTVIVGGVGHARRVGCDIASDLHLHGRIASHWIHNTDADSVLPANFFTEADHVYRDDSALCMRIVKSFSSDPELQSFADMHDLGSHMEVMGMQRAKAPWSMYVTGCGLGITASAYEKIGGMQPYERAEDGHLINAAGKIGRIHRLYGAPVLTEARPTSRPPAGFGTTIAGIRDGVIGNKRIVCSSPAFWNALAAFYQTIELCLTKRLDLHTASAQAAAQMGCESLGMRIMDAVLTWIGPVDMMARSAPAPVLYRSIHDQLDLRKSRKAHNTFKVFCPDVPIMEAIHDNTWAGTSECTTIASAVDAAMRTEAQTCSDDTGPLAWTQKLFARTDPDRVSVEFG